MNASHPEWSLSGKTTGGNALQALITPLKRREPRAADGEFSKRLPKGRVKQKRKTLLALRAPNGVTDPFPANNGIIYEPGSTIDILLIAE